MREYSNAGWTPLGQLEILEKMETVKTVPTDNNCVTHTVALLKPGEVAPDDSPFWCHGCRVRHNIATRIDMHACSPSRTAQVLQHLQEAFPCTTPVETW